MIGVISKAGQRETVSEFFQLFKTPWEFYSENKEYDVIIATEDTSAAVPAKLSIIFSAKPAAFDTVHSISSSGQAGPALMECAHAPFPVHGPFTTFKGTAPAVIRVKDSGETVGFRLEHHQRSFLRIGYDLFDEVAFMLSQGQGVEHAPMPTIELHIAMLRDWIVSSGLTLIEVPPVPAGFSFISCLTHDVDFAEIRNHTFDHTLLGFIMRSVFPRYLQDFRSRIVWRRLFRNWKALLSLPAVYLGIIRDFWLEFDRYPEIEDGMKSTFFFIPFKDRAGCAPGQTPEEAAPKWRAARYAISDYRDHIARLSGQGFEIGLHGLDAWKDPASGREELRVIRALTGDREIGVRMHWLYFSGDSARAIEEAGFLYDSTIGYNETIGYRAGTAQVFLLPKSSKLLELPLMAMDTSMFCSANSRMSECSALEACKKLVREIRTYGGVFTINWHTRSLSPERNWDDFYRELLRMLRAENSWFATAKEAVKWFELRRSVSFESVRVSDKQIRMELSSGPNSGLNNSLPKILLRLHLPRGSSLHEASPAPQHIDIPWSGERKITIP